MVKTECREARVSFFNCAFYLLAAVLVACQVGCATQNKMPAIDRGWSGSGLLDQEQAKKIEQITDKDIATVLDAQVTAKLPTRVAIAAADRYSRDIGVEDLKAWEQALCREPQIQGLEVLSSALASTDHGTPSLHALRMQAANMNCELLLVYLEGSSCVDNYNPAAALYWTFVGLWLVPGSEYERKSVCQAMLVDCRTGKILGTAVGESHAKTVYAAAYERIAKDPIDRDTPRKAMEQLRQNMGHVMTKVVAASKLKAPVQTRSNQ